MNPDGNWVRITSLQRIKGKFKVYNFEVVDNHDYFVGLRGVLVHNAGYDDVEFDEELKRNGTDRESASRLGRKAAEAEAAGFPHGVSVTAGGTDIPSSTAPRSAVELEFKVHNTPTRRDPLHRTVELPKPVTQVVAKAFNKIFGRR